MAVWLPRKSSSPGPGRVSGFRPLKALSFSRLNTCQPLPLPGTRSPQPYPTYQDGILEGGPRDRVWTTGPYLSCKVVALGRDTSLGEKREPKSGQSGGMPPSSCRSGCRRGWSCTLRWRAASRPRWRQRGGLARPMVRTPASCLLAVLRRDSCALPSRAAGVAS